MIELCLRNRERYSIYHDHIAFIQEWLC